MNKKFELNNIIIIIDQTSLEREKNCYYLRAEDIKSPLSSWGTAEVVSTRFAQWLTNTLNAMSANDCSKIVMNISWK